MHVVIRGSFYVVQEAILLVGAATSPVELRLAVSNGLHTALPSVVCSNVVHYVFHAYRPLSLCDILGL